MSYADLLWTLRNRPFLMRNWFWCLIHIEPYEHAPSWAMPIPDAQLVLVSYSDLQWTLWNRPLSWAFQKRNWFWYLIDWQWTLQNKHLCDHSGGGTGLGVLFWCVSGLEKWSTASFASDFASSTCDADQQWKTLVTLGIMSFYRMKLRLVLLGSMCS
jgi:hypothetical protein